MTCATDGQDTIPRLACTFRDASCSEWNALQIAKRCPRGTDSSASGRSETAQGRDVSLHAANPFFRGEALRT
jgi:hypothetical protein